MFVNTYTTSFGVVSPAEFLGPADTLTAYVTSLSPDIRGEVAEADIEILPDLVRRFISRDPYDPRDDQESSSHVERYGFSGDSVALQGEIERLVFSLPFARVSAGSGQELSRVIVNEPRLLTDGSPAELVALAELGELTGLINGGTDPMIVLKVAGASSGGLFIITFTRRVAKAVGDVVESWIRQLTPEKVQERREARAGEREG